jgi:hypothetical protein
MPLLIDLSKNLTEKQFQLNETFVVEKRFTASITGLDPHNGELSFTLKAQNSVTIPAVRVQTNTPARKLSSASQHTTNVQIFTPTFVSLPGLKNAAGTLSLSSF